MKVQLEIHGQEVELLAEKVINLPASATLLVADTHFGKAATFRKSGIPVPAGTTQSMLNRLTSIIRQEKTKRLIILGDFVHSATRAESDFETELRKWRTAHPDLQLTLVAGNHDRGHAKLFSDLDLQVVQEPYTEPPFAFCHFEQANTNRNLFTFAGHVHPAVRLPGLMRGQSKIPCFACSDSVAVLPAFGEFTGTAIASRKDYPDLYAVADDQIVCVPAEIQALG